MPKYLSITAFVVALLIAALFMFPPGPVETVIKIIAFLASVAVALILFQGKAGVAPEQPAKPAVEPSKPVQDVIKGNAEAEVITFLGMLQDKGRFVDFLMEDIAGADDAQLGAVARVVHQGCQGVLKEHLKVEPIEGANEGGSVTLPEGFQADLYQLSGNLSGKAPFTGTLVHKGWKVSSIELPKVIAGPENALPPLAPAQVEVK